MKTSWEGIQKWCSVFGGTLIELLDVKVKGNTF